MKVLALLLLAAQLHAGEAVKVEVSQGPNPWNSLKLNNDEGTFRFAVVTDRTGGHRDGIFETGVEKLNLLQPEFVMSVGDFIEGYTEDQATLDAQWGEFNGFIKRLTVPFFYVPGNHDVTNPTMLADYKRRFGRDYYHFTYKNVLFLCLNSDDPYPAKIGQAQLDYMKKALDGNQGVRWTLVFLHRPLWQQEETQEKLEKSGWTAMERLLKGRPYTVFAGHAHEYRKSVRQDRRYITLATTGGGSYLRGTAFGEFDHVAWVTMSGQGPTLANLLLEGIWHEDVSTADTVKIMDHLSKGIPTQASSLFTEAATLEEARLRLRVSNEADKPLRVFLEFPEHAPLRPAELRVRRSVPPNSVQFIDLDLKGLGRLNSRDLGAIPYQWTLSYDSQLNPPLMATGEGFAYVETPQPLPRRKGPVLLDGKLDEWGPLAQRADDSRPPQRRKQQWNGPEDASFRFSVEHDGANIYVAIQATDELHVPNSRQGDNAYNQDGISFTLEADPELPGEPADPKKPKGQTWYLMMLPGKTAKDSAEVGALQGWGVPGVRTACVLNKGGFTAEAIIPYPGLAARLGKPRQAFRVNLTQYDFDKNDLHRGGVYLNWRPDPKSGNAHPGSGIFFLQDGP